MRSYPKVLAQLKNDCFIEENLIFRVLLSHTVCHAFCKDIHQTRSEPSVSHIGICTIEIGSDMYQANTKPPTYNEIMEKTKYLNDQPPSSVESQFLASLTSKHLVNEY